MDIKRPDILIVGGGILGSSAAWQLARLGAGDIAVLDLDLAGTFSSSELNAGGCRATWWHPINCDLSWLSLKFYQGIASEIQFFQRGYLFLYNSTRWRLALEKRPQYQSRNIPVDYLGPPDIPGLLPEFENLKGVSGATFSPQDGLLDPHLLMEFYRTQAKDLGVRFLDRRYVTAVETQDGTAKAARAMHFRGTTPLSETGLQEILTSHKLDRDPNWEEEVYHPRVLINCTGAWLQVSSRLYGGDCPVLPIRRQISVFSSHEEDLSGRGMIVDSSGLYLHPEGQHSGLVLAGYSNRDEKAAYNFSYDGAAFFDRKIWLRLYRRGARRRFAAIRHVRGWAGLYAVGPDRTGILGRVTGMKNVYEMGAATGRGVMQSYALGLLLAELIARGRFETLDGRPLSGERFSRGNYLYEDLDI